MFGNDKSHKRAARRRLQRISLAAALVACTTAASAIDPPVTPSATSDPQFNLMPPLPLNIGRLEPFAATRGRIERSTVKGIRHNPFLVPEAAPENVVARVSGIDSDTALDAPPTTPPESAPMLLRPSAPVLTLRSIASGEEPSADEGRNTFGEEPGPTENHNAPLAELDAPPEPEASSTASSGRVTFAISDDGVRAKATLGQPATEEFADPAAKTQAPNQRPEGATRSTAPASASFALPQESKPAQVTASAERSDGRTASNASAKPPARSPRLVAAAAPVFDLDLPVDADDPLPKLRQEEPEMSPAGAPSVLSRSLDAADESPGRKFSPSEESPSGLQSVLDTSGSDAAEPPATAMLARRSPRHSSVTDRQPVVIAKTSTPVARVMPKPQPETAAPPASSPAAPPEAKLVKPSRALVIDAPAGRSVGKAHGGKQSSSGDTSLGGDRSAAAHANLEVAEAIQIQSAETQTITPSDPVRRVRLEDREICEAVLVGPHKLLLIGRRDGTTRLAVWSDDQSEPSLYDVTVVSREAAPTESPLHAVAERLTETIAATYPHCHVRIVPQGDGLSVSGQANSNQSAREIMRLVRRACLKSVHDNLEIR